MSMQIIVAVFVAVSAGMLSWMGVQFFIQVGRQYRERFTSHAKIKVADLYLMIEPEKLFALNLIFILRTRL